MKKHFVRTTILGVFALGIGSALVGCEPAQKAAEPGAGIDAMSPDMKSMYKDKMMSGDGKAPSAPK